MQTRVFVQAAETDGQLGVLGFMMRAEQRIHHTDEVRPAVSFKPCVNMCI